MSGEAPLVRRRAPVAILILTYNEALNVEHCLKSVAGWCSEIHVVDSGSTDSTLDIVRAYTDHVYTHEYVDHRSQLTWAFEHVPFSSDWILLLDADNAISNLLQGEIARALSRDNRAVDGYYLAHQYYFRGKPIRGFKPWSLRLLRKGTFEIDQSELVDFRIVVRSRVGYLPGTMTEQNRKEDDIDFWIDKHQKFSSRMAAEEVLRRSGYLDWSFRPKLLGSHDERIAWLKSRWYTMPLNVRPFLYFAYRYVYKRGFLDGANGFVYHFLQAFWFRLLVDIKMADIYREIERGDYTLDDLAREHGHVFEPSERATAPGLAAGR
jgi:glycosyltransferase involved in cell wall biosynthesis